MKFKKRLSQSITVLSTSCLLFSSVPNMYAADLNVQSELQHPAAPNVLEDFEKPKESIKVYNPSRPSSSDEKLTSAQLDALKQQNKSSIAAAIAKDQNKQLASKDKISQDDVNKREHSPDEIVSLIVELEGSTVSELAAQSDDVGISQLSLNNELDDIQQDIQTTKNKILSGLSTGKGKSSKNGIYFKHDYENVLKGFSARNVKYKDIDYIKSLPGVKSVTLQNMYYPAVNQQHDLTQIQNLWNGSAVGQPSGYKGEGMVVAILDTGVDYNHEAFPAPKDMSKAKFKEGTGKYSNKVVAGYNWADQNDDVIPHMEDPTLAASSHGVHVAGIAAGSGPVIQGVAPEAQIIAEKVFSDTQPGALTEDIIKGIDHASALGADVINMSLGSSSSFDTRDPEDPFAIAIRNATDAGHIVVVAAGNASNAYADKGELSAKIRLGENPDLNKIGNPGVYPDSFTVAAANNKVAKHTYEFSSDSIAGTVFGEGLDSWDATKSYTVVTLNEISFNGEVGFGELADYEFTDWEGNKVKRIDVTGKVVLIKRGLISFAEKVAIARSQGAAGVIVYNSEGKPAPALQGFESIPFSLISHADGMKIKEAIMATQGGGGDIGIGIGISNRLTLSDTPSIEMRIVSESSGAAFTESNPGQPTDFSSWGTTSDLLLKPEIMAPGHAIMSSVRTSDPDQTNGYESEDGTSMAAPYVAGAVADVMQALKEKGFETGTRTFAQTVKNMVMNTAIPAKRDFINEDNPATRPDYNTEYQPRRQGAGMIRPDLAVKTPVVVSAHDGTGSVSLKEIGKTSSFTLTASNLTNQAATYQISGTVMTDYLSDDDKTHSDNIRSRYLNDAQLTFSSQQVTIPANSSRQVNVTLALDDATQNNTFVEGYIYLTATDTHLPTLNVPYNGFYGEWDQPSIIDAPIWGNQDSVWAASGYGTQMAFVAGAWTYQYGLPDDETEIALGDKFHVFNPKMGVFPVPILALLRNARTVSVDIVDEEHNLVTHLTDVDWQVKSDPYTGGPPSILSEAMIWDGRNQGVDAPDGQYYFAVTATADMPNAEPQETIYMPIYKDTHAPTLNILKREDYDQLLNPEETDSGSYTIHWTVDDDANPPHKESGGTYPDVFLAVNGSEPYTDYKSMVEQNEDGSYQLEVPDLNDGLNVITLAPLDRAGNQGKEYEVVVDNTSKSVWIDMNTATLNDNVPSRYWSANVKPNDQFSLSFEAYGRDLKEVKAVILTQWDDKNSIVGTPIDNAGTWTSVDHGNGSKYSITGHITIPAELPPGTYWVQFVCLGEGQNWNDADAAHIEIDTYVDTIAPTVELNSDDMRAYVESASAETAALTLNATVVDSIVNSRGYSLSVTTDTYAPEIMGSIATSSPNPESFRYPVVLSEGDHSLVITAKDFMGNANSITVNVHVNLAAQEITIINNGISSIVPIRVVPYAGVNTSEINLSNLNADGTYHVDLFDPIVAGAIKVKYGNNVVDGGENHDLYPVMLVGNQQIKADLYYNLTDIPSWQVLADTYSFNLLSGYIDPGSIPQGSSTFPITIVDYMGNKTTIQVPVYKNSRAPRVEFDNTIIDSTWTASYYTHDSTFTVTGTVYGSVDPFFAALQDYRRPLDERYRNLFDENAEWKNDRVLPDLSIMEGYKKEPGVHPFSFTVDLHPGSNFFGIDGGYVLNNKAFTGANTLVLNLRIYQIGGENTSDQFQADAAADRLTWEIVKGENSTMDNVTTHLALPFIDETNNAKISWSSTDNLIASDGTLTRPYASKALTLTATATVGNATAIKTFEVTVAAKNPNDAAAVAEDLTMLNWNVIRGGNTVQDDVYLPVSLPTTGANGTTITWASDDAKHISNRGRIFKPLFDEGDANVELVAKVTRGSSYQYKKFDLTVIRDTENREKTLLLRAQQSLDIRQLLGQNTSELDVTKDLSFPAKYGNDGISVEWQSNNSDVIALDGKITRPITHNEYVVVDAVFRLDNYFIIKQYGFYVRSLDTSDDPAVQAAQASIVWNLIKNNNVDQNAVKSNLHLPTSGSNDTVITWTSSNEAVISNNGTVTRSTSQDVTVTLTATTTKNNATPLTKTFTIVVAKLPSEAPPSGGYVPVPPVTQDEESVTITETDLTNGQDGKATVEVPADTKEVKLPTNAAELLGQNNLEVKSGNLTLNIPSELLKKLTDALSADDLKDSSISLKFDALTDEKAKELVDQNTSSLDVKLAGQVYEFTLSVISKDDKSVATLSKFDQPITITFKVDAAADKNIVAVYYIAEDGTLAYIGGKYKDGEIVAQISHFSKYAVLEVSKTFSDVPSTHWASAVIKDLVAKQIISGATDTTFNPEGNVTRAEFTKLLVQALKLSATGDNSFTDVDSNDWFANYVSIALKAGIVSGKSETIFAPNAQITREEMVTMMMRAYAILKSEPQTGHAAVEFTDASEVSTWATEYVQAAAKLLFIQGRAEGKFVPKGMSTRAEAAQVIYNMLKS